VRAGIVVFPGSNCDHDCARAAASAGLDPTFLWHKDRDLKGVDLLVLPGGFSFGDYLRCGAIARFSPVMEEVAAFARRGGPVLGICNGFQVLTEAGILPGALVRNVGLHFICEWVHLRAARTRSPWLATLGEGRVVRMPIAHAEGRYHADPAVLDRLEGEGRVAFRYCGPDGRTGRDTNPNGSARAIAGILSENGRILGMMPHPDRCFDPALTGPGHPETDGRTLFEAALGMVA